ncbi:RNA polymerase sigma factor, partial [Burkholderia pseudomallei]
SAVLGVPVGTVMALLSRALERMRALLTDAPLRPPLSLTAARQHR